MLVSECSARDIIVLMCRGLYSGWRKHPTYLPPPSGVGPPRRTHKCTNTAAASLLCCYGLVDSSKG